MLAMLETRCHVILVGKFVGIAKSTLFRPETGCISKKAPNVIYIRG